MVVIIVMCSDYILCVTSSIEILVTAISLLILLTALLVCHCMLQKYLTSGFVVFLYLSTILYLYAYVYFVFSLCSLGCFLL